MLSNSSMLVDAE